MSRYASFVRTALFALLVTAGFAAPASAQPTSVVGEKDFVFAADGVQPGDTIHAAFSAAITGKFHVYSNNPEDEFSIPTVLTVTVPEGFTVDRLVYPEPIKINAAGSDVPVAVFENEFVIGVVINVDPSVAPGEYEISGKLNFQACDDKICLPPDFFTLKRAIAVVAEGDPITIAHEELFASIDFGAGEASDPAIDPDPQDSMAVDPDSILVDPDPADSPAVDPDDVPIHPVEEGDVLALLDGFEILQTKGAQMSVEEFIAFVDAAESGAEQKGAFEGKGIWTIILITIIGGFLLNLTPCVLPLVPINLAIIGAGAQAGSKARGFMLGGVYGLSMALVYGVLGMVVVLTSAKFGEINSTIWFNVAIAALFVVLALAMLDVITIDFTKFSGSLDATGKAQTGTIALAFFMGCVSALLAGACIAPVVIQVIVFASDMYARTENPAYIFLPMLLGIGMALPWPFAGAGLSFLPKPGGWMTWVKKGMGVLILAMAVYYGYLAWGIYASTRAADDASAKTADEDGWVHSLNEGLEQARAENKPVVIDMWATWCKNCLVMAKTTLKATFLTNQTSTPC
jgi:thiol:disulfide interchange protein DsbD